MEGEKYRNHTGDFIKRETSKQYSNWFTFDPKLTIFETVYSKSKIYVVIGQWSYRRNFITMKNYSHNSKSRENAYEFNKREEFCV